MRNDSNKNELGEYLAKAFIQIHQMPSIIVVSFRNTVLCLPANATTNDITTSSLGNCPSEEADQRMIRHMLYCMKTQMKRIVLNTIDTDVLVLAVAYAAEFINSQDFNEEVYVCLKTPRYVTNFNIMEIISHFGVTLE